MKHSLFAIQIFTPLAQSEPLREELHRTIVAAPERVSPIGKHRFYSDLVNAVLQAGPTLVLGHWDYTNDPEEASREFLEWTDGTIRDATDAARHPPDTSLERFMFLTLAVLIERKSDTDRAMEKACAIPRERLWKRATFKALLLEFLKLDFRRVQSDAVFLCPGSVVRGVTRADLTLPAYAYVHELD